MFYLLLTLIIDGQTCYSWLIFLRDWWLLHPGLCIQNGVPTKRVWNWKQACGPELLRGGSLDDTEQKASIKLLGWVGKEFGRTLALDTLGRFLCSQLELRSASWVLYHRKAMLSYICPLRAPKQMLCFPIAQLQFYAKVKKSGSYVLCLRMNL